MSGNAVPPDIEKAMYDVEDAIVELDRVMRGYGAEGVLGVFQEPWRVVGDYVTGNFSGAPQSRARVAEASDGKQTFFFAGGIVSYEEGELEEVGAGGAEAEEVDVGEEAEEFAGEVRSWLGGFLG